MKQALTLCSLALNPNSPSPTATMVRASDGLLTAFGGHFTVSYPIEVDIGCCFNPAAVAPFFRKERGAIAYTVKKNKLVLTEGKERLTVGCLAPEEMAIIDNFEPIVPVTFNMKLLKVAADIIDPTNTRPYAQGVTFSDGAMSSTNNKVFLTGESGLADDVVFTIGKDACVAMTKFKSDLVGYCYNDHTVKFVYEDGSSICAKRLTAEFPDISPIFEGKWTSMDLKEELLDLSCEHLEFLNGTIYYRGADAVGMFENAVNTEINVSVYKRSFDYLLRLGNNLSVSEDRGKLKSLGENCVVVCSAKFPDV